MSRDGGEELVPVAVVTEFLLRLGYQTDVPRDLSPTEAYHRFVPPLGTRLPIIGVSTENGFVKAEHFKGIRQAVGEHDVG